MEQIIQSISAKFGLPEAAIRSGLGIILNFIKQKATGTEFEKFAALLPGSVGVMASAPQPGESSGGGLLGGLLQKAGGLMGGNIGEAAEALGALNAAGIPMDKAAPVAEEFLEQAKSVAGPDAVAALVENIPALKKLLAGN